MNVGFIGMGNMGQMLVTALAQSGCLQPGQIVVSSRNPEKLKRLAEAVPGLQITYTNQELAQRAGIIFLCVKPGETKAVMDAIGPYISADHLLVTITNSLDISMLEGVTKARVAKVIPSMVQRIQEGVCLVVYGDRCTHQDKAALLRLAGAISQPYVIQERQARVASDLTSCGPAFLSYAFRSLAQAARKYQPDLSKEAIDAMIRITAMATCRLLETTGLSFDDVIDKVSTPGGVTADGIKVLDEHMAGVWEQVIETTIVKEEAKKAKVEL